ncbi:methyltransferase small [Pseudarthrobacter chlorophenolicus A6]|uniref:Methyltransferase small n=1 Tax=Pseudarthrobacter chlorophenolicus (strain ATCC 700700 / DSM 12829 / CIP 107037 / JCM 12360 / KCTC 9906 / NCIMB 13794 / A6) TaxID=452863 RepID=B8HFR8_PSECP|nr:methyltransferase [Pseudarthrobacter chlorophenolicus]ACL41111.1 methyltransferase small [Pseudarthrobacter chlorophenolicus A6]SDQ69772.1 Methyltransferase small domain-containing protein [Pseudarthrobacter chlorophenolicus]
MPETPFEFTAGNTPDAPRSDLPHLLRALAADLRRLDYTLDGVAGLLGPSASAALNRDQIIPAMLAVERAVREDVDAAPLAAVVSLWLLAEPQERATLDAALPGIRAEGLEELGLLEPVPGTGRLSAKADLRPYGWDKNDDGSGGAELWVASDLAAHQQAGVLRHDHVLGIGQASTTLVQTTVRRHTERALDLGTGCGIQSFHLLHHCEHVTATDISERALAFTRFNILLNAEALSVDPGRLADRVSLRLGSLLEPVAGEEFGLVVSNPPFVITPRSTGEDAADQFTYRDGGLPGDDIVASLVADLPTVLAPGGTAQMLGNWEVAAGAEWHERPQSWVRPGTDAWFIQREQVSPEQYAETWLQDASEGRDRDHYRDAYGAYLADFASRNVEGIGFGMVWLRRPAAETANAQPVLRRFEEISYPIEQPVGPHLGAAVERSDWLAAHSVADTYLLVAGDVTEERHQRPGAEHPGVILLRQGAGLRRTNLLSTELAGFVSACDGDLTAGQIAGALEALLGSGDDGSAEGSFRGRLLADVENLVRDGFLVPAEN